MPQIETITLDEKLAISNKAFELLDAGDREGFSLSSGREKPEIPSF